MTSAETKKILLLKGFKTVTYNKEKFYEKVITDIDAIEKILDDYEATEEKLVIQISEDLARKNMSIDDNVWDISDCDLKLLLRNI